MLHGSAQETQAENLGLQFVGQCLVSQLERAVVDRRSVATGVTRFQCITDLIPAHIGPVELVLVAHSTDIGFGKVGFPQTPPAIQHGQCFG